MLELEHSFVVPATVATSWAALHDLPLVAGCLPGAALDEVTGDRFTGSVKVRLGPMQLTYRGAGSFVERDAEARRTVAELSGREAKGAGTASATLRMELAEPEPGQTEVTVRTSLNITGRPAQFGRSAMEDVATQLLGTFAANMADAVAGYAAAPAEVDVVDAPPLNLLDVVGGRWRRVAGAVAGGLVTLLVVLVVRRMVG